MGIKFGMKNCDFQSRHYS